jgi:molybdopterin/thiamine biosynthesis adenylyltransferase
VLGPLVGFAGALMADFALRALALDEALAGKLASYSALADELREITVSENPSCPLCGQNPAISRIEETRYTAPSCAA